MVETGAGTGAGEFRDAALVVDTVDAPLRDRADEKAPARRVVGDALGDHGLVDDLEHGGGEIEPRQLRLELRVHRLESGVAAQRGELFACGEETISELGHLLEIRDHGRLLAEACVRAREVEVQRCVVRSLAQARLDGVGRPARARGVHLGERGKGERESAQGRRRGFAWFGKVAASDPDYPRVERKCGFASLAPAP